MNARTRAAAKDDPGDDPLPDLADTALPMALAERHHDLAVGSTLQLTIGDESSSDPSMSRLNDLVIGAGFTLERLDRPTRPPDRTLVARVTRQQSLPDTVGADMRLLVCGLNPSIHAAEMGVGFGRPGNRFWPAALRVGLVTVDRDPWHALREDGVGMTDLVKRATTRADELASSEYADGVDRLDRICAWLEPRAVCIVGLAGWRTAVDRRAGAGVQSRALGGRPVYLMPSTSGLNAHSRLDDLVAHLEAARGLADGS